MNDERFMQRCIELALRAEGKTYPNPMVGAVVVCNDTIIGEGYHHCAGEPHAEVNAIASVEDKSLLPFSTIYVSLEPCSHFGKTPPCADLIIKERIRRVVVGTQDTNAKVSGEGIKRLRAAGCEVKVGVLEEECRHLNRRFFTFQEKKRPYIILKWAESRDGYMDIEENASAGRGSYPISSHIDRVAAHRMRSIEQAILVGGKTIRVDNPRLDVRYVEGKNPLRLILSRSGNIPHNSNLFGVEGETVLFTATPNLNLPCEIVILDDKLPSGVQVCNYLYARGVQSLIVEGGAEVLNHFISLDLFDETVVYVGDKILSTGLKAPNIRR